MYVCIFLCMFVAYVFFMFVAACQPFLLFNKTWDDFSGFLMRAPFACPRVCIGEQWKMATRRDGVAQTSPIRDPNHNFSRILRPALAAVQGRRFNPSWML